MDKTKLTNSLFKEDTDDSESNLSGDSDSDLDIVNDSDVDDSESGESVSDEDVDLSKWEKLSTATAKYKPFKELHDKDVDKLKKAQTTGNLDGLMLKNTSDSWKTTIENGIVNLKNSLKKSNQSTVNDTIKNLNRALSNLEKITPKVKQPSAFKNAWREMKHVPTEPRPKPLCFDNEAICNNLKTSEQYDIQTLLDSYNDSSLEEFKCCIKNVQFDDKNPLLDYRMVFNILDSLDTLALNYNTKQQNLLNTIPEKIRKQITTVELVESNSESKSIYIPFDYQFIFPSLVTYKGMYTSPFSYIFKYITDASVWVDDSNPNYFDINEIRLLQFLNLPNIENLRLTEMKNKNSSNTVYNLYIHKLPKLITFEDSLDVVYDTLRIHNVPKCQYLQSKMTASKIDLYNIGKILSLDLIVKEYLSINNLGLLKTLSIKLEQHDVKLKLVRLPNLETLMISGDLNLGNSNQNIVLDCSSIHKLQTLIIEGTIISANQKNIDNFIYEIISNNKNLSHININGISITGPKLFSQYNTFIKTSLFSSTHNHDTSKNNVVV